MTKALDQTTRRSVMAAMASAGLAVGLGACGRRSTGSKEAQKGAPMATATEISLKPITHVLSAVERHWVGDGFWVSTILAPHRIDAQLVSPFVLMDHAAPRNFAPAARPRGVGEHPHRGFETVTFAYQGEVQHRDSHGGGGTIGAGDVQWMTAASGVVHEEMHSKRFTESGGTFEMVQLWVNLPARLKMTSPRYQALSGSSFPRVHLGDGSARLIAGQLSDKTGPAKVHTPITMFDLEIPANGTSSFELPTGMTTLVFVLQGEGRAQDNQQMKTGDLLVFDRSAPGSVSLGANANTRLLVLADEPLEEPVVAHGPFVMNKKSEIVQAIRDYQEGRMGHLAPTT